MFKTLKQQQGIILAALLSIVVIVAIGYFVAVKRSEPMYRSKVDELMFDEKNKSPKYIITLPDHKQKKSEMAEAEKDNKADEKNPEDDGLTPQQRVLSNIPVLTKLTPLENMKPLANTEIDSTLVAKDGKYILPAKSGDKKPWLAYGKKVSVMPNFYRVAIVFKNFGIDKNGSAQIIKGLPENISFSFSPYAQELEEQVKVARKSGHETYVDLLLSSKSFLDTDTGPLAMDITASQEELINRVKKSLSINAPVGGMIVNRGDAGVDSMERLENVFKVLENMGLLMVNGSEEETIDLIRVGGLARNKADLVIDNDYTRDSIASRLKLAETIAKDKGLVVIVAEPKPLVVLEIKKWVDTFSPQLTYAEMKEQNITAPEKPFALVPISNIVIE